MTDIIKSIENFFGFGDEPKEEDQAKSKAKSATPKAKTPKATTASKKPATGLAVE